MKRHYIVLLVLVAVLCSCKDDTNPPTLNAPNVTGKVEKVSYHEATIVDTFQLQNDNVDVVLYYTDDALAENPECGGNWKSLNHTTMGKEKKVLTTTLNNLTDGTEYYYMYAFSSQFDIEHGEGKVTAYSQKKSFTTLKNGTPDVQTIGSESCGFFTAIATAEKRADNSDSPTTSWGVCYALHENPTVSDSKMTCSSNADQTYKFSLSGLDANTTYYFRAYGVNRYGTSYGEVMSFKTVSTSVMTVETEMPTTKGSNYAILTGKITAHEKSLNITKKGFYLSATNQTPDENDRKVACDVSGDGAYQVQATGLYPSTTYYVRGYAVCQYGELKGNVIAFTTEE